MTVDNVSMVSIRKVENTCMYLHFKHDWQITCWQTFNSWVSKNEVHWWKFDLRQWSDWMYINRV